ncbi:ABC transporter ATP-binding protein [Camelliibacillus cellulosilyticus]|uniref:ABC transporter ATP-binding protein n=1 Tax=Camelliibacillus cellulosilyticus TaxID=2174486 RepID=A0ABV9GTG5_9BACL
MATLLEVKNLKTSFVNRHEKTAVVNGLNFSIQAGETLGIVGESGCGKSVTSLSIMQLLNDNAEMDGEIWFDGADLLKLKKKDMQHLRGNQLAMIFQEPMTSLNPLQSIGKQIAEPLIKHLNLSKREAKARVIQLLKEVGIPRAEEIYTDFPHQLSGGMRQRIMIAMAMACQPKLIIADEPTTALDVTIQAQILDLMKKLKNTNDTAIMLITHDLGVVAEMCDRVIVMYAGEIVEEADVYTLFKDPQHPYTKGLMASIPSMATDQERLASIPGQVPPLNNMPKGCRFAPRCPFAMAKCHEEAPPLFRKSSDQHGSCCWLYEEEAD